jgi:hypothetical protein
MWRARDPRQCSQSHGFQPCRQPAESPHSPPALHFFIHLISNNCYNFERRSFRERPNAPFARRVKSVDQGKQSLSTVNSYPAALRLITRSNLLQDCAEPIFNLFDISTAVVIAKKAKASHRACGRSACGWETTGYMATCPPSGKPLEEHRHRLNPRGRWCGRRLGGHHGRCPTSPERRVFAAGPDR